MGGGGYAKTPNHMASELSDKIDCMFSNCRNTMLNVAFTSEYP